MKTQRWINKATVLSLLAVQAITLNSRAQADEKGTFCDLRIRPRIELVDAVPVATLEGAYDYTGRTWIGDGLMITGCVAALGLFIMPGAVCLDAHYFDGNSSWAFQKDRSLFYAQKNHAAWYEEAFADIKQACGKYLKKHYKDDIIEADGMVVRARNYTCSEPRLLESQNGIQIKIDVLKGTPVYNNLNLDQIRAEKCTRLLSCYAEASETEALEWIQQKQLELGCN